MKVIFLDFDGVINSADECACCSDTWLESGFGFYQKHLVDTLNILFNAVPDAKIVVSSTWRLGKEVEQLQEMCKEMGIKGEIVGKTPRLGVYTVRGNEIAAFIQQNKELLGYDYSYNYNSYVIIDDDSDMLYPQRHNFVHTKGMKGIQPYDVVKAIEILTIN